MTPAQTPSLIKHWMDEVLKLKFIVTGLGMVLGGLLLMILSRIYLSPGIPADLAGDIGLSLVPSGTLFLILEFYTRRQYLDIISESMSAVMKAEEPILAKAIAENALSVLHSDQFRTLGLRKIYPEGKRIEYAELIKSTLAGEEIRILGIALTRFAEENVQDAIRQKLVEGCRVRLLCLDNSADEVLKIRSIAEEREYSELVDHVGRLNGIHLQFINERIKSEDSRKRIEFRLYNSSPAFFIFSTDSTMIVGFYLFGERGINRPYLEFEAKQGGLYNYFIKHFDTIWKTSGAPVYRPANRRMELPS